MTSTASTAPSKSRPRRKATAGASIGSDDCQQAASRAAMIVAASVAPGVAVAASCKVTTSVIDVSGPGGGGADAATGSAGAGFCAAQAIKANDSNIRLTNL